jgi:hypothetical protein
VPIEMVLQGVVAERRTPYGEGVIDVRIRNALGRHGEQAIVPLGVVAYPPVRRGA